MFPKDKVKSILAEKLGLEITDIDDSNLLAEDLGINGGTLAEVLETIKERTGVEVPVDEAKEVGTVAELVNAVEENTLE